MLFLKKKSLNAIIGEKDNKKSLAKTFSTFDLIVMGAASIIGSGLFSITGLAAQYSGSAVFISYIFAGLISILVALIYAELSCMIPGSGFLYDYVYITIGELPAFVMLGIIFFETGFVGSFAASVCSDYIYRYLNPMWITLPEIVRSVSEGGMFDLIAVAIILFFGAVVYLGNILSQTVTTILVIIKMLTILLFIFIGSQYFSQEIFVANFNPLGFQQGILGGSAMLFFAFSGYGNLTSTVEECKNPNRSMTIALIVSIVISIIVYSIVSILLTGIGDYINLKTNAPLTVVFDPKKHEIAFPLITAGVTISMFAVIIIDIFVLSRVFFVISRDGLIFKIFSKIDRKSKAPSYAILFVTVTLAAIAGTIDRQLIGNIVMLSSLLTAFIVVILAVFARIRYPEFSRPFKAPFLYLNAPIAASLIVYLLVKRGLDSLSSVKIVGYMVLFMVALYFILRFLKSSPNAKVISEDR